MTPAFAIILTLLLFVVLVPLLMKGWNPQFALLLVGIVGLIIFMFATGQSIVEKSTGNLFFDGFQYLVDSLNSSFVSTGITLCVVLGYVEYMNYLKANDVFAIACSRVVNKIKSKYVIILIAMVISVLIKWVIPSAVTAFLMLFACVYPILRRCGISRITAIGTITICMMFTLGPGQPFTGMIYGTFAPESGITGPSFFVDYELKYFLPVFVVGAASFIFMSNYFDKRDAKNGIKYINEETFDESVTNIKDLGVPSWYGLLPIIPLVLVIVLGGGMLPFKVGVVPVYLFMTFIVVIVEMIRRRAIVSSSQDFMNFLEGMGVSFGRYATVVWAGVVFADAVSKIGGLDILINMIVSTDTSAPLFMLLIYIIVMIVAILTSQVVLCIFGIGPIITSFANLTGASIIPLLVPMGALATGDGILSLAAAVTLVAAEKAGLKVTDFILRMSVPAVLMSLTVIGCSMFMFGL